MMKTLVSFNVNEYVHVQLTDRGRKILFDRHDALNRVIQKNGGHGLPELIIQTNENNLVRFQMWEFMQIFGPFCGMGSGLAFYTDIYFETTNEPKD